MDIQEIKEAYMDFLLTPETLRSPRTKHAFAQTHGITTRTMQNWTKHPVFQAQFRERVGDLATNWHGDILNRLKDIVEQGEAKDSIAAARILLQHLTLPKLPEEEDDKKDTMAEVLSIMDGLGIKVVESG